MHHAYVLLAIDERRRAAWTGPSTIPTNNQPTTN